MEEYAAKAIRSKIVNGSIVVVEIEWKNSDKIGCLYFNIVNGNHWRQSIKTFDDWIEED